MNEMKSNIIHIKNKNTLTISWFLYFIVQQSSLFHLFSLTKLPAYLVWGWFIPWIFVNTINPTAMLSAQVIVAVYSHVKKKDFLLRSYAIVK